MADIQSPLPGTFYHRPSPEGAPYKSIWAMAPARCLAMDGNVPCNGGVEKSGKRRAPSV